MSAPTPMTRQRALKTIMRALEKLSDADREKVMVAVRALLDVKALDLKPETPAQ